jgi:hypothetical protein
MRLAELGKYFPCETEGYEIAIDDTEATMEAGDVLEAQWVADRDISIDAAFDLLVEALRMKEEYPEFVLHFVRVETRKITMQYSIAPSGASHSPAIAALIWIIVKAFGIILGLAVAGYLIYIAAEREYIFPAKKPTGNATIIAKHTETKKGISGVKIYRDGNFIGKTDGGSVSEKNILTGDHQFAGEPLAEFHDPAPVTATIVKDKTIDITIWYRPVDIPEPSTGYLYVYTSPVIGTVYVKGEEVGPAPQALKLAIGDYKVGFGPVDGYITPETQTVTIVAGDETTAKAITGYYLLPGEEEGWEKYLKYGLIGVGVIAGSALVLPPVIRAIREKRRES